MISYRHSYRFVWTVGSGGFGGSLGLVGVVGVVGVGVLRAGWQDLAGFRRGQKWS